MPSRSDRKGIYPEQAQKDLRPVLDATRCIYCGAPATCRDHVPPRGIFIRPFPSDLITVPSCDDCNNGISGRDERFRNIIALRAAIGFSAHPRRPSPNARQLLDGKVLRALRRNPRQYARLLSTAHEAPMHSHGGIALGHATAFQLEEEVHDLSVARIVQGLYAHHYGLPLKSTVPIRSILVDIDKPGLQAALDAITSSLTRRRIGGDAFEYAFARAGERPDPRSGC